MEDNIIKIYADGACRNNQCRENIGGIGVVLQYGDNSKEFGEAYENTTNHQMEILSVIRALESLKRYDIPVEVYSDSQYVVNTINLGWRRNANIELWVQLDELLSKIPTITFHKVKGHSDNIYNNRADQLANEAMDRYKR